MRNKLLGNEPIAVTACGLLFRLVPKGGVAFDIWSGGHFEARELEFVLQVLQPGMTFVDVGANVGLYSVPASKKVQGGKVFAFEPTPWTYQVLLENIRLNNLKNVCAERFAVGDAEGEAVLKLNVAGKEGLNTIGRPAHEFSDIQGSERVPITRLDDFVDRYSIQRVDVLKIDVEGAELLVLRGAQRLLRRPDAPLIVYESGFLSRGFDYHPVEQAWLLEKHGFHLFVVNPSTGEISEPLNGRAYDSMVIAAKPSHPAFAAVKERAR
jgi:FkbM family methyltransferase